MDCMAPIKTALLSRGIAMGNEYRFDEVSWKIITTRTADLFLEVLREAVAHRLAADHDDIQPAWRMAIGKDELLIVPPAEDRERLLPKLREIMDFLRDLLFANRFVATVLREVLRDVIASRLEETILAGTLDKTQLLATVTERLDAMDLAVEGVGADQAAAKDTPPTDDAAPDAGGEPQGEGDH